MPFCSDTVWSALRAAAVVRLAPLPVRAGPRLRVVPGMDLTTEAIKQLKQAFTALPTLPGTERVAAAEVLGLLQSLGPAASMPSTDHLFRLIEQVTKEAAAVAPTAATAPSAAAAAPSATAAATSAASATAPRDASDGVPPGPPGAASPVQLPGCPGATSPRAFPARPPLPPPPLPAAAVGVASPVDADAAASVSPMCGAAAATGAVGGRGHKSCPPSDARRVAIGDARLKQAVDAGWGKPLELGSSSEEDLIGENAAAAAAAAVSRKVVRHSAGDHRRRSLSEVATGATASGAEAVGCGGPVRSPQLEPKAAPAAGVPSVTFGPHGGRKLPPVPPPVSDAGRAAPAAPRRGLPRGGARASTTSTAVSTLPSLDFRAFLLVVVRLLHELETPAVAGGGDRPTAPGGPSDGDHLQHAPRRAAAPEEDPIEMMSSVFRVLDVTRQGALRAEDLQVVLSGFGGEPVSADQAAAMVELALSTGPGGLDAGGRPLLQPFGAAVGVVEFSGVYEMVQQANQRRAAEAAAAAAAAATAAERRQRHSSSSGFFKWDHHRREPQRPPSPDTPNGGSPRDVPPLEVAAVSCTGSPRGDTGRFEESLPRENGPDGSPPAGGRLRQVLTRGERSASSSGSASSRLSSPRSTSAHSLSSSTGRLTNKPTGGAQTRAAEAVAPLGGANLV